MACVSSLGFMDQTLTCFDREQIRSVLESTLVLWAKFSSMGVRTAACFADSRVVRVSNGRECLEVQAWPA